MPNVKRTRYDEKLAQHPVLENCSRQELALASRHSTPLQLSQGTRLMSGRGAGRDFLLVGSGTAAVTIEGAKVAELAGGDFCGELSLLDPEYERKAEVVAETDMEVFAFDPRGFRWLMQEVPVAADRIREAADARRN